MTIKFDVFKSLQIVLLVAILVLTAWSQPWDTADSSQKRTISIEGTATIDAEPNEYTFYPYFEIQGTDSAATEELNTKGNTIVDGLKALGVEDAQITLNANSYDYGFYFSEPEDGQSTLNVVVEVASKDLAQQVQDFLQEQGAKGSISPQGAFSTAKQNELETMATEQASEDARTKAEAQAALFGAKLGDVVSINSSQFGGAFPLLERADASISLESESFSASLPIQQGTNEYSLTVSVIYELQ